MGTENSYRDEKIPTKFGKKEIRHFGQNILRQQKEIMEDPENKARVFKVSH